MTRIHVRFSMPGFHRWPDATAGRKYLASKHRHLFMFEVTTAVHHVDREIEFHDLLDAAKAMVGRFAISGDFGALSCEAIARHLGEDLCDRYSRPFEVSVWEDGECGATVTYP